MPISTCHNIISKMHPQLSSKKSNLFKVKGLERNWNVFTKFRVQFTGDSGSKMILVQSCRKWWGAPGSEFWYLWNGFQINSNRQNHNWLKATNSYLIHRLFRLLWGFQMFWHIKTRQAKVTCNFLLQLLLLPCSRFRMDSSDWGWCPSFLSFLWS